MSIAICAKPFLLLSALSLIQACSILQELPHSDGQDGKHNREESAKTEAIKGDSFSKIEVPPDLQKRYAKAITLMKAEKYQQALGILREIAQTSTNLSGPHVNLGIIYLKLGKTVEAEQALKQAVGINQRNPAAHNLLGMLHRRKGLFDEAEISYQKALTAYPNYPPAHLNMGILCDLYLHNAKCAMHHYERYLQLSDDNDKRVSKWLVDLKNRSKPKTR